MKLQGIFPPITTPFDHAGNIYAAKLQHNIEKWNRTTLAGYVVTGSTGGSVLLPAAAVMELSHHPNIIGIKESSGNMEKVMQMMRESRPGFQVTVGSAPTLWPSLLMGAPGAILAFANAAPYAT